MNARPLAPELEQALLRIERRLDLLGIPEASLRRAGVSRRVAAELADLGLIEKRHRHARLTDEGRDLLNWIA